MDDQNLEAQNLTLSLVHEKTRVEIEKLKAEIQTLKGGTGWGAKIAQYNPVFTVLIAVIGTLVSIQQFNRSQESNTKQYTLQQKEQSDRDLAAREQESKKKYWEEQNQTYKEACDAAATVAIADSLGEVRHHRQCRWLDEQCRLKGG